MRGAASFFPKKLARNPGSGAGRKIKACGHHSDNGIDSSVHRQMKLGEVRGARKIALPITVADDDGRRSVLALLLCNKGAAEKRLDAERLKEVAGDCGDVDTRRLTAAGNGR